MPENRTVRSMPVGKHKGVPWGFVPLPYLEWVAEEFRQPNVRRAAQAEIGRRKGTDQASVVERQGSICRPAATRRAGSRNSSRRRLSAEDYRAREFSMHCQFVMPNGVATMIPEDVDMTDRCQEACPFDETAVQPAHAPDFELDREYREIVG